MKSFVDFSFYIFIVFSSTLLADDEIKATVNVTEIAQKMIVLDKTLQANSGLKTVKLKQVIYRAEKLSYGTAISIEPLMMIQSQYLTELTQQSAAKAKTTLKQNNLNRQTYLHKEGIVSSRTLEDLQATLLVDNATLASSYYLSQQLINHSRLLWGNTLTDWMIKSSPGFENLIAQRNTLLKITFPAEFENKQKPPLKNIFVSATEKREQAVAAQLISAAPQVDNFSQGQHYFYQIPTISQIKPGMRVNVWIPAPQQMQIGVVIPESALCWHLGQALVFIKITDQQFSHRFLSQYQKVSGGYFVSSTLKNGEEIVSSGAQMLLSEQFKGQIPSEDND